MDFFGSDLKSVVKMDKLIKMKFAFNKRFTAILKLIAIILTQIRHNISVFLYFLVVL